MKGVILGNGFPPNKELVLKYIHQAKVYCCDGAANWAMEMSIPIDLIIGDMDSIRCNIGSVQTIRLPREKDDTDMQAGVNLAIEQGCTDITLLGALGSRADHSLANIHLLVQMHKRKIAARIADNNNIIFVANSTFEVDKPDEDKTVFSILPLESGIHIDKTSGLYYPVLSRDIPVGVPYFVSNVWNADKARIELYGGYVAVMLCKD